MKRLAFLLAATAFASPAWAFDCGKASTTVEKAICADDKLKAADDAMSKAYGEVRNLLTDKEKKSLALSQKKWLKGRDDRCSSEEGAALNSCILDETESRRRLLSAESETGPGSKTVMIPVFIQQEGDRWHTDVDYTLIRFGKAVSKGEKVFNAEVNKIVKAAPLGKQAEEAPEEMNYMSYAAMSLAYASERLISAPVEVYSFEGGAHGNSGTNAINVDLKAGKLIAAGDIFDGKALGKLKSDCIAQILVQKKDKWEGEEYKQSEDPNFQEATVGETLANMTAWTLSADKATVTFDAYVVGSYAEGPYSCEFPMEKLRGMAKSGAPLPE